MKRLLMLTLFSFPLFVCAQIQKQPEYGSFQKARTVLDKAIRFAGIAADTLNMAVMATGINHESGHYPSPGERIDMPDNYTLQFFQGAANYFLKAETTYRERPYNRQVYAKGDSLFFRSYFARSVTRKTSDSPTGLFNEVLTLHPVLFLQTVRRQSLTSLRYVGKTAGNESISTIVNGTLFTLQVATNGQLNQVSYLAAHDYYGDNVHTYQYSAYRATGGFRLPTTFREYEFGALRKEQTYTYNLKSVTELPVNQVCPGCSLLPRSKPDKDVTTQNLGGNLYAINLNQFDNRSFVLIGEKSISVFEAPLSYAAGQSVVRAAQQLAPNKPIGQVMVTHHHPDHAGGLQAFVEAGAEVITTKGNVAFLGQFVNFPHQLSGQTAPKTIIPSFALVDSSRVFNAGTSSEFSVYFTGNTEHTNEYLLAYFPTQKILFHGDLCFFSENGETSPASVREQAVGKAIARYKPEVEKIYGSWPIRGYKAFGTKAELDKKLQAVAK